MTRGCPALYHPLPLPRFECILLGLFRRRRCLFDKPSGAPVECGLLASSLQFAAFPAAPPRCVSQLVCAAPAMHIRVELPRQGVAERTVALPESGEQAAPCRSP
ncbi:hypothetical protein OH77DRAFT_1424156 [Trametes cingulata]|nr:hypothetical protein OH77DRAFT_1424156 [Trametes cingulata]